MLRAGIDSNRALLSEFSKSRLAAEPTIEWLIHEACTRLRQLDLPVEQIACGLSFRDPAYFNRFFRKYQNASPGAYRRRARRDPSQHGPSYAAWP